MDARRVYVVQDRETGRFLCPRLGDIGQCVLLTEAGRFEDPEDAEESGQYLFEQDAVVVPLWELD
ncbi:hypothetical protein GPA19_17885 [Azoarcus indigens]|uniref:Uncharacterized protein n=1 Tax=Azoarcus indigens TaxID=29545 RepID=A0A4R6DPQ3_9RHOO|nr:hypothetical protein [Azoarcus indigens]NMG66813.1 hypothetical protein [Azoarcus indigens]TDN46981.1 hypothetical protein C7389_12354 [Azoarcus indigens]